MGGGFNSWQVHGQQLDAPTGTQQTSNFQSYIPLSFFLLSCFVSFSLYLVPLLPSNQYSAQAMHYQSHREAGGPRMVGEREGGRGKEREREEGRGR